jgi:hypothetical protein
MCRNVSIDFAGQKLSKACKTALKVAGQAQRGRRTTHPVKELCAEMGPGVA